MRPLIVIIILLGFEVFSPRTFSQSVTLDGEFRPRAEFRDGFKKPLIDTLNPEMMIAQRSRLKADYTSNSLNAHLTLQDARIWGQSDTKTSASKIEIYEAWVSVLFLPGLSAQFGRQVLSFDDGRLFSGSPWSNTGSAHDAMLWKYKESSFQAQAVFAYNNTADTLFQYPYAVKGMYQSMGIIWLSRELSPGLNLSLIGVGEGLQKSTNPKPTVGRFTEGGNITFQSDSSMFGGTLTMYDQRGRDANFKGLRAFLFAVKGSLAVQPDLPLQAGFEYYSGSAYDADSAHKSFTFNRLYGTNHSFNGPMEYWSTLPAGGLVDYYAGITYKADQTLSINLTGHIFSSAQEMTDKMKHSIEKNLGSEADLMVNYQWSKEVAMQGGWSLYFPTTATKQVFSMFDASKNLLSTTRPQWVYVMLTVKPFFLKNS